MDNIYGFVKTSYAGSRGDIIHLTYKNFFMPGERNENFNARTPRIYEYKILVHFCNLIYFVFIK